MTVTTERRGPVGIITFNRPEVLNAFNGELKQATTKALADFVAAPEIRAIVVHGQGRAFSAGFDMKESAGKAERTVDEW